MYILKKNASHGGGECSLHPPSNMPFFSNLTGTSWSIQVIYWNVLEELKKKLFLKYLLFGLFNVDKAITSNTRT
jgi:hypothetical protein